MSGHYQLIQRSTEIIKTMSMERVLTTFHVDVIWSVTERNDEEAIFNTFKSIGEVGTTFTPDITEYIVDKIISIEIAQVQKEHVQILADLTKYPTYGRPYTTKVSEFFWHTCTSIGLVSSDMIQ